MQLVYLLSLAKERTTTESRTERKPRKERYETTTFISLSSQLKIYNGLIKNVDGSIRFRFEFEICCVFFSFPFSVSIKQKNIYKNNIKKLKWFYKNFSSSHLEFGETEIFSKNRKF
ncbi:hypothetical protein ACFFRR_004770 [Megaselia abdita]